MSTGKSPEIQSNKNLSINKQTDKQTKPETLIGFIPELQELQVYFSLCLSI